MSLPTSPIEAGIGTVAGGDGGTIPSSSSPAARPSCWRCGSRDLQREESKAHDVSNNSVRYLCRKCDRRTTVIEPKED